MENKELIEENKNLREENELLRKSTNQRDLYITDSFMNLTKKGNENPIQRGGIQKLATSLEPLRSTVLRKLTRKQLLLFLLIVLYREAKLYEIIHDYNDKLKNNDREIFKNLRKEVNYLHELLVNKSPLYDQVQIQKDKINELEVNNRILKEREFDYESKLKEMREFYKNYFSIQQLENNFYELLDKYKFNDSAMGSVIIDFYKDLVKSLGGKKNG